jgi:recombination protein RecA
MATAELDKFVLKINKKLGAGTIVKGSEIRDNILERFPSGSLALDVALGGGWTVNQWHEIVGEASNGKTAIALKTIAANQKRDPEFTTVWIAAEQWVPSYADMCGVDTSRVYVISTNVMEDAMDAVIELAESRNVDCIVIDSLPALVPSAEDDREMGESTVGRAAIASNKFFRKVGKASKRSLVDQDRPFIGIMINQWRSKIGVMYGDPRTTPGGLGKDYSFFTRIEVKRDDWIEVGTGDNKRRVGQTIKIRTLKNKSSAINPPAYVDFYFAEGGDLLPGDFDAGKEIVALGILNRVITRAGAYYRYGDRQWQGGDAILKSLREEIDLRETLEKDVLRSILESSKFVAESDED